MQDVLDGFHYFIQAILIEESKDIPVGTKMVLSPAAADKINKEAERLTELYGPQVGEEQFQAAMQEVISNAVI